MRTLNRLSDEALRELKPPQDGRGKKHTDGNGLYAFQAASGLITFRLDYRLGGKRLTHVFGRYPELSLDEARERLLAAKRSIADNMEPTAKAEKKPTFAAVAAEFIERKSKASSKGYLDGMAGRLRNHILPLIGHKPIDGILPIEVLGALKKLETLGKYETAHKLLSFCGQIFRYAVVSLKAAIDPTASIKGQLAPVPKRHRAALTDSKDVRRLLLAIDDYRGGPIVTAALKLAPLVFVRPGQLRRAEWAEIDLNAGLWRIPARKTRTLAPHVVPLATQAVEILTALQPVTGAGQYVFPGQRTKTIPISDMTLLNAIRSMGFGKDEMTAYGFRTIASIRLKEIGYNADLIERQLAHSQSNYESTSYNLDDYLPDRIRMMQDWANYLYLLKGNENKDQIK